MELPRLLTLEKLAKFLWEPMSVTNISLTSFKYPTYKTFVGKVHLSSGLILNHP